MEISIEERNSLVSKHYLAGWTMKRISTEMNLSVGAVFNILHKQGVETRPTGTRKSNMTGSWFALGEKSYRLRESNMTWKAIACRLKCSHQGAHASAKHYAETTSAKWPLGRNHHSAVYLDYGKQAYHEREKGRKWKDIAVSLNMNIPTMFYWVRKYGQKCELPYPPVLEIDSLKIQETKETIRLYQSGLTMRETANVLGVSYECVKGRLRRHGVSRRRRGPVSKDDDHVGS